MQAEWRFKDLYKADATAVANELSSIKCTPENIVEYARNPESELHKCFEWNDTVAAEKYRIEQARQVLRTLVIKQETKQDKPPLRLFYKTNQREEYKPINLIVKQNDEYQIFLKRAQDELRAFKRKYHFLTELEEIFELIE